MESNRPIMVERVPQVADGVQELGAPVEPIYRAPQLVSLGTAVDLMCRDGTGHLIDGIGGWWVWGS